MNKKPLMVLCLVAVPFIVALVYFSRLQNTQAVTTPAAHTNINHAAPNPGAGMPLSKPATPKLSAGHRGKVLQSMNTAGYTYVLVDTGSEKIWAAAPEFQVKVGDEVIVPPGAPMRNYHSKTLDRTFELVYFVGGISKAEDATKPGAITGKMPVGHPAVVAGRQSTKVDLSGIPKAKGGMTVAEIYAQKAELGGKKIIVRGKVVKYSPLIMDKNWIHLRDGTGTTGTNDLTITTAATAKVGDTILVTGQLTLDKDFGAGYKYELIIEDAAITVEP